MDWLPEVLGPTEVAGRWSDAGDALVAPGTGDNMAAALGLGLHHRDLALSLGTSLFMNWFNAKMALVER